MANKAKKISVNAFENAVKDKFNRIESFGWNGLDIQVKKVLTLEEMVIFVEYVVKSCFGNGEHEYNPEMKYLAIKNCIIDVYTNLRTPTNINKKYDFIYQTDIIDTILSRINIDQYNEIIESVDRKISYMAQKNISMAESKTSELCSTFESIREQLMNTFSEIDKESVAKIINDLASGKYDMEKIAVDAISKSNKEESE